MKEQTSIPLQTQPASAMPGKSISAEQPVYQQLYMENLQRLPIQYKLSIGAVDDPLENEADAMADHVMRMPDTSFVQRKCAHCEEEEKIQRKPDINEGAGKNYEACLPAISFIQRKCAHCEDEEAQRKPITSFIQKKENGNSNTVSNTVHNQIQSTKGGGSAIPANTKTFMENRFGTDFSNVRIHSGGYASQLSKELNAQAFTVGSDIYFNDGKFSPDSSAGKHLLAHELTHTVQQGAVQANSIQRFTCTQILNAEEQQVSKGFGVKAHQVITRDFKSQFPERAKGFRIPGATSAPIREGCGDVTDNYIPPLEFADGPEPSSNRGIPDLAFVDNNRVAHLAEIKIGKWGCRDMAENQVARYTDQGNMDDPEMQRYRNSPHMKQSLKKMGLNGPLKGFKIMNPSLLGYNIPQSVLVDGVNTQVAGCGNGVIIYKNVGEESDDKHLCDQSPDKFIDKLIAPAEGLIDKYIDKIVNPAINQLLDTLSLEEMITLAYQKARPAIRDAVIKNFGRVAWEAIAALDDETAVHNLARLIEHAADNNTRALLNTMVRKAKEVLIEQVRKAMRRLLRSFIQKIIQQLCESSATVSVAAAIAAIASGMSTLFNQAIGQVIEQAVIIAAMALAVVAAVAIVLAIVAIVVVVVAIVFLLPEILAALGIGGGVVAAESIGAGTLAAGAGTGAVITEGTVIGSGVTSTGVTLTLLRGGAAAAGAGAGTTTTVVATGAGGSGIIKVAAAAALLFFGMGSRKETAEH